MKKLKINITVLVILLSLIPIIIYVTDISRAIDNGFNEYAKLLINIGIGVNKENRSKVTPLIAATKSDSIYFIDLLLKKGADIDKNSKYGTYPLSVAIKNNSFDTIKFLVESGADVNKCSIHERNPLSYAVYSGSLRTVKYLVNSGANVNECSMHTHYTLSHAIINDLPEITNYLIENGSNINLKDRLEYSPLRLATTRDNLELMEKTLVRGANDRGFTYFEATALEHILNTDKYLDDIDLKKLELLLNNGWELNTKEVNDNYIKEGLLMALKKGKKLNTIKYFTKFIDITVLEGNDNYTLLDLAFMNNSSVDVALFLYNKGIKSKDYYVQNSLIIANNRVDLAYRYFFQTITNYNITDDYEIYDNLNYFIKQGDIEELDSMLSTKIDLTYFDLASVLFNEYEDNIEYKTKTDILKLFIRYGYEINFISSGTKTLLGESIKNNHREIFNILLENDVDADIICRFDKVHGHQTPLLLAAIKEDIYYVKKLIEYGANVNAVTAEDKTVFDYIKK